jgi:hypothetical protein
MTFEVDAEVLLPAARVAERAAADLRDAGLLLAFGPTGTDDAAALERLRRWRRSSMRPRRSTDRSACRC